eukprot:11863836-Alexandrium_andersonii.AAC.1
MRDALPRDVGAGSPGLQEERPLGGRVDRPGPHPAVQGGAVLLSAQARFFVEEGGEDQRAVPAHA